MSSLSSYYIFSSLLFLLLSVLSFIVFSSFQECPYSSPIGNLFLIIGLANTFIFVKMLFAGFFIKYFSNKTPEDLSSMNIFLVILSIMTKLSQKTIKILHLIKFLLTIILLIFIISMWTDKSYISIDSKSLNNYTTCKNYPIDNYSENEYVYNLRKIILIVYISEGISYFVSFILFGIFKSFITEDSFIYNPEFPNQYCCTILIFHKLGP